MVRVDRDFEENSIPARARERQQTQQAAVGGWFESLSSQGQRLLVDRLWTIWCWTAMLGSVHVVFPSGWGRQHLGVKSQCQDHTLPPVPGPPSHCMDKRAGPRGKKGKSQGRKGEVSGAEGAVPGARRKFLVDLCWADPEGTVFFFFPL